ncbi:MAG: hypothetical protein H8E94_03010 [Alphaproteobacteria bacterium]|nr:hypothetical protein [Alphaproteobacteria bacterium]
MDDETLVTDEPLPDEVAAPEIEDGKEAEKPEDTEANSEDQEKEPKEGDDSEKSEDGDEDEKPKRKRRPSRSQRKVSRLEEEVAELRRTISEATKVAENPSEPPKPEDFADYDAYQQALIAHKVRETLEVERTAAAEREAKVRQETAQRSTVEKRDTMFDAGTSKYDDFEEVFHDDVPVSPVMAEVILESESGADLAYYLGQHSDEAAKIARMNPLAAARELTRIEFRLAAKAPRKVTGAPAPVKTVGGGGAPEKDVSKMTTEEYRAARASGKIK